MNTERLAGYVCSLPERAVRSLAALAGGAAHEFGAVVLPQRVRRSRLYESLVETTLRFLVEQVGGIEGIYPGDSSLPDDFLLRRAAGNVIELAGFISFRASPVWVLAALADLAGAGRDLIVDIADALEKEGLLEPGRRFESVDQLLDGLERTAGRAAETVNTPPLDIRSLREEWSQLRGAAAHLPRLTLPPADRLWSQWRELKQEAAAQGRPVVELSSAMAVAAVRKFPDNARWLSRAARISTRRTGEVLARGLLDHYRATLAEIRAMGYGNYWLREFQPYFRGCVRQFSPARISMTERLLARRRAYARSRVETVQR